MQYWKSRWILVVASLHTIYVFVVFGDSYLSMLAKGLWQSMGSPRDAVATWFFVFGLLLFVLGFALEAMEKAEVSIPKSALGMLWLMTILGVVIMPASGFWLLFASLIGFSLPTKSTIAVL